jgi:hypothetical protein
MMTIGFVAFNGGRMLGAYPTQGAAIAAITSS